MTDPKNFKFGPDFHKLVLAVNAKVDYLLQEVDATHADFEQTGNPRAEENLRGASDDLTDYESIQDKLFELSDLVREITYSREKTL